MYATFQIVHGGTDLHLLARQMGTSIAMLEQHYSHLIPRMRADKLAGRMKNAVGTTNPLTVGTCRVFRFGFQRVAAATEGGRGD